MAVNKHSLWGKLEPGHARQGEPPGTGNYRNGPAGGRGPPRPPRLGATLPAAQRVRQAESSGLFRILREGVAKQGRPAARPRLEKKGIREEVACLRATHRQIKERFVGPLARLLSGQGSGRIGRRAELGRCAGAAQVVEASSRASRLSSTKSQPSGSAEKRDARKKVSTRKGAGHLFLCKWWTCQRMT